MKSTEVSTSSPVDQLGNQLFFENKAVVWVEVIELIKARVAFCVTRSGNGWVVWLLAVASYLGLVGCGVALLAYNQRKQQTESLQGLGLVVKGYGDRGRKKQRGKSVSGHGRSQSKNRSEGTFEFKCYRCHEPGHMKKDCSQRGKGTDWKKKGKAGERKDGSSTSANVVEQESDDGDMLSVSAEEVSSRQQGIQIELEGFDRGDTEPDEQLDQQQQQEQQQNLATGRTKRTIKPPEMDPENIHYDNEGLHHDSDDGGPSPPPGRESVGETASNIAAGYREWGELEYGSAVAGLPRAVLLKKSKAI
ncbi:hypothetical protein RHSIM_RhsimUnG0222600 [Rhododendron simsii]|uniref:CCHC-type domain-containing protein n=1 Tax=Rhododendron simsii TaxID=118357 RepID=A0A834FTI7_RHOSS|nr:hypothetical protein RHSIM_RhsimUnG0222600 [Rhododendron simsii]